MGFANQAYIDTHTHAHTHPAHMHLLHTHVPEYSEFISLNIIHKAIDKNHTRTPNRYDWTEVNKSPPLPPSSKHTRDKHKVKLARDQRKIFNK